VNSNPAHRTLLLHPLVYRTNGSTKHGQLRNDTENPPQSPEPNRRCMAKSLKQKNTPQNKPKQKLTEKQDEKIAGEKKYF
jgi:hypothetical protein